MTLELELNGHYQNKDKTQKKEEEEEDLAQTSCGFGSFRPKWMQVFATPVWFLVNISFVGICQGMAGSLVFTVMNTLEKRYAFDSKISAMIFSADNYSGLVLSPLIGLYGIKFNRSRLIAIGEIILAFSCLSTALPYFIYGPGDHLINDQRLVTQLANRSSFDLCSADSSASFSSAGETCSTTGGSTAHNTVWGAVIILFLSNFFRGVGFTTYYVIAMPYIDDNTASRSSPVYLSVIQCVMLIGPAVGFYFSSLCLSLYEDPFRDPEIPRADPRFVGAWWLGFVITGLFLLVAACPMYLFPPQFKGAPIRADVIKKKMKESGGTIEALKRFIRNPMILIYFFGNLFRYFGVLGFYMMLTKYIENQYRVSSSQASMVSGTASVTPISVGILIGGVAIYFFKPNARTLFTFVFVAELTSFFTIGSGLFLGCEPINLGATSLTSNFDVPSSGDGGLSTSLVNSMLNATCNSHCACSTRVFTPICGPDRVTTYFSPCHAGCAAYNEFNSTFDQCSCFSGIATKGYCPKDTECSNLNWFLAMMMLGTLVSSTAKTGNQLITYRTVDPMDKSVTNGILSTLLSLLAFIPSPLVFGYLIDSSCSIWEVSSCGKRGNCWLYDQAKFRNRYLGVAIIFMALGSFFDFLLIFYSRRVKNLYDDDVEESEGAEKEVGEMCNGKVKESSSLEKVVENC